MKFGGKQISPMEQVGILIAVMVMALYAYLTFFLNAPSRKMQRLERKYKETRLDVARLSRDQASGRTDRQMEKLRKKLRSAEKALSAAENMLAQRAQTDVLATRILQMASQKGFMIQSYARMTDKNRIRDVLGGPDDVELSYYSMTVRGPFALVIELLQGLQAFPKLVAPRRIRVTMPDNGAMLETEIWFSL